jgi:hypothetical protein
VSLGFGLIPLLSSAVLGIACKDIFVDYTPLDTRLKSLSETKSSEKGFGIANPELLRRDCHGMVRHPRKLSNF